MESTLERRWLVLDWRAVAASRNLDYIVAALSEPGAWLKANSAALNRLSFSSRADEAAEEWSDDYCPEHVDARPRIEHHAKRMRREWAATPARYLCLEWNRVRAA